MSSLSVTDRRSQSSQSLSRASELPPPAVSADAPKSRATTPVDGFSPASRKAPVELGGTPVKGAPLARSASVESLFAPKADALGLASGAGSLPTVPQVELDPGADGPDVRNLQDCLVQLGYISQDVVNSAPGHFGPNTEAAMRAFQADHGLEQVGRFGPGSRAAMNTAIGRMGQVDSIIDNAYRGLLGREADTGGRLSWRHGAEQMLAGGGSMDQVRGMIEGGIKNSPEYQNRQPQNPTQVVNDLYNQILERPGDPGGVQSWTNRYNQLKAQGMGAGDIRATLANEMRAQPEYAVKETVKDLYRGLLQRDVDPVGRKSWTDYGLRRLGQGASIDQVRNEVAQNIMNSEEYQKLHGGKLPNDPNHSFSFQEVYPTIQKYAAQYGTDPKVLAAIVAQESSFTNWIVHRDGTGHGMIGLDDGGLKPDFQQWVRDTKGLPDYTIGNGGNAISIEPDWQMEYLAKTITALTNKYGGNIMAAAREWHTGAGGVWSGEGDLYESLIRQRMQELFG